MNSPLTRAGCGGVIGGVTPSLRKYGIPPICVTDGPSGLRFENGDKASSLPCGTMLACSWNTEAIKKLFTYEGMEVYANNVDALLGPGMNIHRIPLCGRNFEYFSEDPLVSGEVGAAICRGLDKSGVTAVIKHFAANNKEAKRNEINAVISERALREIYLKPFEITIKNSNVSMVMTSYNILNGVYCSANYDLTTDLLRKDWGYTGLVMSDWWPKNYISADGQKLVDRALPVAAQNDLFMVNPDAAESAKEVMVGLSKGSVTRAELWRNAISICNTILHMPNFERFLDGTLPPVKETVNISEMELCFTIENPASDYVFEFICEKSDDYGVELEYYSPKSELIQISVKLHGTDISSPLHALLSATGTNDSVKTCSAPTYFNKGKINLRLVYDNSITVKKFNIYKNKQI